MKHERKIVFILPGSGRSGGVRSIVVMATDCGGTRDILKDGENGYIVPVGNVKQIIDRVLVLLNDTKIREQMREKALETVNKFRWNESVDKFENILDKLDSNYS